MPRIPLPTVRDLSRLIRAVKADIDDDYRADIEDDVPGILLTVGWSLTGEWSYQTGDNSFTGGAYGYPHWAVVSVYRRSSSVELARDIRDQLMDVSEDDRSEADARGGVRS